MVEIPTYLTDLFRNPTLVFQTLFQTCEVMLISGFTAFGPKYIESQFSASPAEAGMYWGKCNTHDQVYIQADSHQNLSS